MESATPVALVVAASACVTAVVACTQNSTAHSPVAVGKITWTRGHTRGRKNRSRRVGNRSRTSGDGTVLVATELQVAADLYDAGDFAGSVMAYEASLKQADVGSDEAALAERLYRIVDGCNKSLQVRVDGTLKGAATILYCRAKALLQIGDLLTNEGASVKPKTLQSAVEAWCHGYVDILTAEKTLLSWQQALKARKHGTDRVAAFAEYQRHAITAVDIAVQKTKFVRRTVAAEVERYTKNHRRVEVTNERAIKACGTFNKEPVLAQVHCVMKATLNARKSVDGETLMRLPVKPEERFDVLETHQSSTGNISIRCALPMPRKDQTLKSEIRTVWLSVTDNGRTVLQEVVPRSPSSLKPQPRGVELDAAKFAKIELALPLCVVTVELMDS
eukprot:SAG31_NODE_3145_length_4621_cov_2.448695_4_plen_389_part_00